jgi:hypothetical protein
MLVTLRTLQSAFLKKARLVGEEQKKHMAVDFGVDIS